MSKRGKITVISLGKCEFRAERNGRSVLSESKEMAEQMLRWYEAICERDGPDAEAAFANANFNKMRDCYYDPNHSKGYIAQLKRMGVLIDG